MSYFGVRDFGLEASLNKMTGYLTVNKYGRTPNADNGVDTDIWDGANGITSTAIWVPPKAARVHTIVSPSLADSGAGGINPASTGMRTMRIYYLPDWDTAEATEDVVLDGTTGVVMSNAAVMINRMRGLTWGTGGKNVGIITATAATDATITSAMTATMNQTHQCIYGIPSTQKLRVTRFRSDIVAGLGQTRDADGLVTYMIDPATNVVDNTAWIHREHYALVESVSPWDRSYDDVPKKFDGPGILKMQVNSNSNDTVIIGAFEAYLVTT